MTVTERLAALGVTIPVAPIPVANYVPVRQAGDFAFASGQTPTRDGVLVQRGKLGRDVTVSDGQRCAELAVLNCLAALNQHLGSLDEIVAVIKLTGYVASAEGFGDQPAVINGASLFLEKVLGEAGRHARAAIGVAELPGNAPVEVDLIVQVAPR
jgi:enamine deaminase RidA (YjgF/YER057c/UK114 family)